jgi:glucosylceramidase
MARRLYITSAVLLTALLSPLQSAPMLNIQIVQTTRSGDRLQPVTPHPVDPTCDGPILVLDSATEFQTLIGIGGSFTESTAYVIAELSQAQRSRLMDAWFGPMGAHYSLTRTHIASCDFSLRNYSYAPVPADTDLQHFSIEPDRTYLLPMIQNALSVRGAEFKILASPWTAPPWMKSNQDWNGGELLEAHYPTFAAYILRYLEAYEKEGITIWGLTPINEPLGNNSNWESMHFTPDSMARFIGDHLGPLLKANKREVGIWVYDQNREELMLDWAAALMGNPQVAQYVAGMAVHWYQSTRDVGGPVLDAYRQLYPQFPVLHSEGCIDALGDDEPIGAWLEDDWYWRPEATDWGFRWASDDNKPNHPPYQPFYRYTRDLIEGLNHGLAGWIDWNMALNTRGGPNHARNFCLAPVLVDSGRDAVYFTPLFYAVAHFSKYMRPGARRIGISGTSNDFIATAVRNPDNSVAVAVFNMRPSTVRYRVSLNGSQVAIEIPAQALQTVVLKDR